MKKYAILILLAVLLTGKIYASVPYLIEVEQMTIPGSPALHSFAFAQYNGKWLFLCGRTNGLHGFQLNPFPRQFQNKYVYVVDPNTNQVWSRNLFLDLAITAADPLRSTNTEFTQINDKLYITGGYGIDSSASSAFVTFPVLSVIDIPGIMNAVMNNTSMASSIKQVTDSRIQVTGGEMEYYNGYFYMLGGHKFSGTYFNTGQGTNNQQYTNQLKKFKIDISGSLPAITDYSSVTDTVNFHRRDLNLVPAIKPDGSQYLIDYGGVFRYDRDLPFLKPINIDATGYTVDTYQQQLNQYTTANLQAFDSVSGEMNTTFFGGISQFYFDENLQTVKEDTLVPFINEITTLTKSAAGVSSESIHPMRLPDLLGANAQFIISTSIPRYSNDVIRLRNLSARTFAGYIYGGIKGSIPNGGASAPSDKIYKVYITPGWVGIMPIGTGIPSAFNLSQNYPNPFNPTAKIRIDIPGSSQNVKLVVYNSLGKEISTLVNGQINGGSYEVTFDGSKLAGGVYFYRLEAGSYRETRKMLLIK